LEIILKKKWEIKNSIDNSVIEKISKENNLGYLIASILANKNIVNKDKIDKFLNPKRSDFSDPFLMPDMKQAIDRIEQALNKKEKIVIYGDYDVDGITSSAILKRFFKENLDYDVDVYIPNRITEGYGLNIDAIQKIIDEKYKLIITVDCGITAIDEINKAKENGIDVIVTDHHEQGENIPEAIAVVDLKRKDCKLDFREFAGCGVAFKLIQALSIRLNLKEECYLKYLDIAAIGTISDIVPLIKENRTITKLGLMLLKQTKNIGLRTLINDVAFKAIDSNSISFGLAPRINACGRMGHQDDALELLLTDDPIEARKLVATLNGYNNKRQEIEKNITDEVIKSIESKNQTDSIIVEAGEGWHHGVIGIVSSKITDMYNKPSILLSIEDDLSKGSGRSIQGFDLHEALINLKDEIVQAGGHSMAIGMTIKTENIEAFREKINEYALANNIQELVPIIEIDSILNLKDINIEEIKELSLLEPFGEENNKPIFRLNKLKIESIRALTEGKHLKLDLVDENMNHISAIGFFLGYLSDEYRVGDVIDIIGNLEINSFNNIENIQILIKDIRHSI
jgi:single-stranded-DNA-specific exonuclease